MTAPWWGRESSRREQEGRRETIASTATPELLPASRTAVVREVRDHIPNYTPEWTLRRPGDPGDSLMRLFGEQMEPVLSRLNRLPEKAFVEFLRVGGVQVLPATPAVTLLEFEVSDSAPQSVPVPQGFQVGGTPAGGGDMVIFETERTLYAAPATIKEVHVQERGVSREVDLDAPFSPFGRDPRPGTALFLGLLGEVVPGPLISVGFGVASPTGAPPPVASGGVAPSPVPPPPILRWDVLDGSSYEPAEVVQDGTAGLLRSGVVELRLPRRWQPARPEGLGGDRQLRWLRLRIVFGRYMKSPVLSFVKLNVVGARATRTIRNEILEPVPGSRGARMSLSQTPVLPGSLVLEISESDTEVEPVTEEALPAPLLAEAGETGPLPGGRRWREVDDFSGFGPDDEVFVLDAARGEVTFGDGLRGKAVPPGFRHVRAVRYRVGGGATGALPAEKISNLVNSTPFLTGAKNPLPATGGTDTESQQAARRRGPQEIRTRGRAVTLADYELLALRAPGAQVMRAHAVSGLHPSFPGRPIPGVVCVYVVPPDRKEGPPIPEEGALRSVSEFLSEGLAPERKGLAPAGIEVVAAAPRYHRVRVEAGLILDPAADVGDTIRRALREIDKYLHPLQGGDDEQGWPFGGTIQYASLVRRLIANGNGVRAVPRLNLVVDGVRNQACQDFATPAHHLLWPEGHEIVVVEREES